MMHEQNVICSKTLICRQLFAGYVVSSRPIFDTDRMIIIVIINDLLTLVSAALSNICYFCKVFGQSINF